MAQNFQPLIGVPTWQQPSKLPAYNWRYFFSIFSIFLFRLSCFFLFIFTFFLVFVTLLYFIFIFASVKKFSLTLIISLVMSLDTYEGGQWLFGYKFSGLAINLRTTWCNHSFVIFYARSAPPPFCAHIACLYCPFFVPVPSVDTCWN